VTKKRPVPAVRSWARSAFDVGRVRHHFRTSANSTKLPVRKRLKKDQGLKAGMQSQFIICSTPRMATIWFPDSPFVTHLPVREATRRMPR
jgi:hypothetical protein